MTTNKVINYIFKIANNDVLKHDTLLKMHELRSL